MPLSVVTGEATALTFTCGAPVVILMFGEPTRMFCGPVTTVTFCVFTLVFTFDATKRAEDDELDDSELALDDELDDEELLEELEELELEEELDELELEDELLLDELELEEEHVTVVVMVLLCLVARGAPMRVLVRKLRADRLTNVEPQTASGGTTALIVTVLTDSPKLK